MARDKTYTEEEFPSPLVQLWHNFKQSPAVMIGFGCFIFLVLLAIFSPLISPYSPIENNLDAILLPPAWHNDGDVSYLLGTDNLGRDMLSRLMHGASLTFGLSFIVVILSMFVGVIIGSISALTKGVKSSFLNHFLDVILSIPSLLLAIIIVAILGPGLSNTLWAIVIILIPQFIHITRNAVVQEFKKDYVLASKLDGASNIRILYYSIYPNIIEKMISQATLAQSAAILDIATLGFLGLGAPIPMPEWGAMLANGIDLFYIAPWTVYLPGLAILFAVVATNLVGEGMRHALKVRKEH
ncbi:MULTISPECIES: ABC transporter permease subunit [Thalassotalea]|uniref:ABC transporter permease subunit n=1 Tax=Thalassotalea TaxID=1518149 RepID=UPI000944DB2B|nr:MULTISPECIES: ABC transporter permease subunit [Thalassotalea]MDO6427987.1 ABC transporter permease subunit [Thalassotalea sp. 1_MG-2023]OKY25361.1 peptide ABC transporter permease [Thalassotalea sp. PP2-459]